jgi:hypothetical protein
MRHNKVPLYRARARAQFQTICDVLSALNQTFRSASTTADMAKKLLKEMDRVVSTVAAPEQRKLRRNPSYMPGDDMGGVRDSSTVAGDENCKLRPSCWLLPIDLLIIF